MSEVLGRTKSLCPTCLKVITADRVQHDGDVFIEKRCPEHGEFKTIIWRGEPSYKDWGMGIFAPGPSTRQTDILDGCPYDCGICTRHKAQTCSVLMEVTSRCDMNCPVCFASSEKSGESQPTIKEIEEMLDFILESGGPYPLQLSGGEPTLRDDLPAIVSLAKEKGFAHIQVNTHGLRLANDKEFLWKLGGSGIDLVYLQFDGVSDEVYRKVRGANLAGVKTRAVENCAEAKVGVQLVPTIIPGVNDHEAGAIVRFASQYIPFVKGVHFQPVSYFGRYPAAPSDEDRITTPDLLRALEYQTEGEVRAANFLPRRRHDAHCGFSGFFVQQEDGRLTGTNVFKPQNPSSAPCPETIGQFSDSNQPARHVREFITEKSRYIEPNPDILENYRKGTLQRFLQRARTHFLSISGMPFQDAWTVDLERLQGCCIHVVTQGGRLIPFCAYYITSAEGRRLPGKGPAGLS
ncbi:MAG: radical SAM protein [Dehalococcoidia bacterium]